MTTPRSDLTGPATGLSSAADECLYFSFVALIEVVISMVLYNATDAFLALVAMVMFGLALLDQRHYYGPPTTQGA